MNSPAAPLRRRFASLCCTFAIFAGIGLAQAQDKPTFSDPAVTAFARDYSDFIDQYSVVMKGYMEAVKSNDTPAMQKISGRMQEFQTRAQDLQTQGAKLQGKIKPEEAKQFSDYMQTCMKKLTDALK